MLLRTLLVVAFVWLAWRLLAGSWRGPRRGRFPCSTCRHCGTEFDDGVICRFEGRETFKNEVHIANCGSWQRR